ncbi:MAG: excinuclease ABC subunit UvrA [bacterium]
MLRKIIVRGARQNNLKNISLEIDHNTFTVVTGVSGSGKSSLAFDTLYAEGMRRFVESQTTYARQFLERLDKPDVDAIEGLYPTIAVQAKNTVKTARSTVGTTTEIYDYLRLLFAKAGTLHCPQCGCKVHAASVDEMIASILDRFAEKQIYLMAPLEVSASVSPSILKDLVRARGYSYIMIRRKNRQDLRDLQDKLIDLETAADDEFSDAVREILRCSGRNKEGTGMGTGRDGIYIVVDRLRVGARRTARLVDSLESALKEGGGECVIADMDGDAKILSGNFRCTECGVEVRQPVPQELSFNNPLGACPACTGFGDRYELDMDAIISDPAKTLREGAIEAWNSAGVRRYARKMLSLPESQLGVRVDVPYKNLTEEEKHRVFHGYKKFYGIKTYFDNLKEKSYKASNRFILNRYRSLRRCTECGGTRLNRAALRVRISEKNIAEICAMPIEKSLRFFEKLHFPTQTAETVKVVMREILSRMRYLADVGLGYLTLDRLSRTLSGGEMQRIHLASYLSSRLTGTLYVLDEPTVGLHPRDTDRLLRIIKDLRDLGNTVLVVEHDMQVMREADRIIDLGPGAGENGGEVVFNGAIGEFYECEDSLTASFLRGERKVTDFTSARFSNRALQCAQFLTIKNAAENNLKNITVNFPLKSFTCVTGVSGSGKSSLICDVLYPQIAHRLGTGVDHRGKCDGVEGWEDFSTVEMVGQSPISTTPRSNPATFIQVLAPIRGLFAATSAARERGMYPGAFSFNSPLGQCPKCQGAGSLQIDMQFLSDIFVTCDECSGKRYRPDVLEIEYNGLNISKVLGLTVSEAMAFFRQHSQVTQRLQILIDVGLGYVKLGQPLNTLSGGECQRLKIASELAAGAGKGNRLYLFDEPTMGLHAEEVGKFLRCIARLISKGHTVIVIEHNLDVIAQADFVIDLGPEGGDAGGYVVAEGSPQEITEVKGSYTGRFLKEKILATKVTKKIRTE